MDSILLVEDDLQLAEELKERLSQSGSQNGSFDLRHAESAEEALDQIQGERPDLLIVDWILPKMNGPRFIEELRESGERAPIIKLTVRDSTKDRVRGLESGADDYVTKPFDFKELEARIRALLRRPPEWKPIDRLSVGPLTVNSARRQAVLTGGVLDLRKKEFDLLLLLVDNEPDVVTRSVIAERIWGTEHVSDNSIDVTVSGLRKKISDALVETSGSLQLETARGVGYRLTRQDRAPTS
jgi:DNA-binding response OmpR family regulator